MLKITPLYETHRSLGGRLIEFGGWEMPVQYTGIVAEHMAVRQFAGMFDISHMGEVMVSGPVAERFLNRLLTNDVSKLLPGHGHYSIMCNEEGGAIDDLYVYRQSAEIFLLVINASRIGEDVAWILRQFDDESETEGTHVFDVSEKYGALAVQGPAVKTFIDQCFDGPVKSGPEGAGAPSQLLKNQLLNLDWLGNSLWIARTGYTGEDGFEIIATEGAVKDVWQRVMEIGQPHGLTPSGLGARDTLRTEACYPLYGHELSETITPIEAGVGFFVKLDKGEFVGRAKLAEQKAAGPLRKSVALRMTEKCAPPRPHYPVYVAGAENSVGEMTSGTQSPSLGCGIGLALMEAAHSAPGTLVEVEIRGRRFPAEIVKKPIYSTK